LDSTLDQAGVDRYIARFIHYLGRSYASRYLRIVGIHNYSDANRRRTTGLRKVIRSVHRYTHRPNFWLTETGGVVRFGRSFPCNETRAAHRLDYLFDVIHHYHRYLQRVYLYNWFGASCKGRMDVGSSPLEAACGRATRWSSASLPASAADAGDVTAKRSER
jgi:hypothetical protein